MVSKLALGTVQFGLNYGINNSKGKTHKEEVQRILAFADKSGITLLDTAYAYGNSEEVLGHNEISGFKVISKLPPCKSSEVKKHFETSLERLQISALYGYMFHNFEAFSKTPDAYHQVKIFQDEGKVEKIGFSLYKPEELEILWERGLEFQLLQFPYNILDRRFEPYFRRLKDQGVEIHVRSIFLQGLFFRDINDLPLFFSELYPKLKELNSLCKELNISKSTLCLNFAINNPLIDKVVIGVDSLAQLENNIAAVNQSHKVVPAMNQLLDMKEEKEDFILPTNWKL